MALPPSIFKQLTRAFQISLVNHALIRCQGNVQQAARMLEVSITTIERFMRLHAAEARTQEPQGRGDGHTSVSPD